MTIGEAIHKVRVLKGMKLDELATKSGLGTGYLSMIENNKREPSLAALKFICDGLDMPVTLVMMLTEANHPHISPFVTLLYPRLFEGTDHAKRNL